jgi:exopolysaccharide/PEP-CTERM locus tyrosine autokinase
MTTLETALAMLRAQSRAELAERGLAEAAADGDSRLAAVPRTRDFVPGGRRLEVDFKALRQQGYLVGYADQRRLDEEYRVIKRPLLKNASTSAPRMERGNLVLLTSAVPGEGKTFTCINLCMSIARNKDWSVLLVDGDCKRPRLSKVFGAERERGLMDLLKDPDLSLSQVVMPTSVERIQFLPAGQWREDVSELLASSRMDSLCTQLAAGDPMRIVLFDSSPLLATTDALFLAAHVGQIAVVVRADHTPQQAVLASVAMLDQSKAIGLILNQVSKQLQTIGYDDYYGSYGPSQSPTTLSGMT